MVKDRSRFWKMTVKLALTEEEESFVLQGPACYDESRVTEILMEVHDSDWGVIKTLEPIERPSWANAFIGD